MSQQKSQTRGVRLAVLGDLHYQTKDENLYQKALRQILTFEPDAIACLGDLSQSGKYAKEDFKLAKDFFLQFKKPYYPLIGNHDLEFKEFNSDEEAIKYWTNYFDLQNHYYAVDLKHTLLVFLSSEYHRRNLASPHEVKLSEQQINWFKEVVQNNAHRPIYVFTHAPILGSGLKVLQSLHLKVPNVWVNHTEMPEQFIQIVEENPQIKLWFSGHNHLGHYYENSLTQVNQCAFVHVGVMGSVSRDGFHHTRFLEFGDRGCVLSTVDHDKGQCIVDALYEFESKKIERYTQTIEFKHEKHYSPPEFPQKIEYQIDESVFVVFKNELLEFDFKMKAPLGVVEKEMQKKMIIIEDNQLFVVVSKERKKIQKNKVGRFFNIFYPYSRVVKKKS